VKGFDVFRMASTISAMSAADAGAVDVGAADDTGGLQGGANRDRVRLQLKP
jgi:hypothetical protein